MKRSKLFIDESGQASLASDSTSPFILTGVIVDDEEIKTIEGFFSYIKRKYSIEVSKPFHSYETFENNETKLSPSKAKMLVADLADFIGLIPIFVKIISIDRIEFKKSLGIKTSEDMKGSAHRKSLKDFPYRIMAAYLFEWFANHLESGKRIGEIVADARRGGDAQLIKTLYQCKEESCSFSEKTRNAINENCTAICFAEKNYLSGGLEITDIVSYTAYQHAKRIMSSKFSDIELNKLWTIIKGLLPKSDFHQITDSEIKTFFQIEKDGVHKYINE